jgi:acyl-CoA synthetase (AMP-forming)/AMP-acid ligase II
MRLWYDGCPSQFCHDCIQTCTHFSHMLQVGAASDELVWPNFPEDTASSLCYTSGTSGNPKGVLYSHRSTVLHSWGVCMTDTLALSCRDSLLLIVPLFHANAWGVPYAASAVGAKLVLPAHKLDGASVYEILEAEKVSAPALLPLIPTHQKRRALIIVSWCVSGYVLPGCADRLAHAVRSFGCQSLSQIQLPQAVLLDRVLRCSKSGLIGECLRVCCRTT